MVESELVSGFGLDTVMPTRARLLTFPIFEHRAWVTADHYTVSCDGVAATFFSTLAFLDTVFPKSVELTSWRGGGK